MDDLFGDDAWGEEPDWAKTDSINGGDDPTDAAATAAESPATLFGAQHVILLVDCHHDMFQDLTTTTTTTKVSDSEDSAFRCPMDFALSFTQQLLQQRIRDTVTLKIGKRNGVGLVLYNTCAKKRPTTGDQTKHNDDDSDDETDLEGSDSDNDDETGRDVHVLIPLVPPGIDQVQTIRDCVQEDGHHSKRLQDEFAALPDQKSPQISPLQVALEEATRMFRQARCVKETQRRRTTDEDAHAATDVCSIWILTNREHPYPDTTPLIRNVAQDIRESGTQIVVVPLVKAEADDGAQQDFSMDDCFESLVSYPIFENRLGSSREDVETGLETLVSQWKKIRRLYWGPLLLPDHRLQQDKDSHDDDQDQPQIMVDWFRFVQLAKKPTKVQVDQQTKRETIKVKQYMDNNVEIFASFRPSDPNDRKKPKLGLKRIRQSTTFGGEQIPVSSEDMAQIRFLANGQRTQPGLTLLGFKPIDSIPIYHSMDASYFIYPNDTLVKGSRAAFIQLHSAMLRKNVLAIGEVLHRTHWSSRLVALYPMKEELEYDGDDDDDDDEDENDPSQKRPPGMLVVTLPFEDDIRNLDEDEAFTYWREQQISPSEDRPDEIPSELVSGMPSFPISQDLLDSAQALVSKLRLTGVELGEDFENAALTEFFNYLESVALELPSSSMNDDDDTEGIDFDTRPNDGAVREVAGELIDSFVGNLPAEVERPKASGARKRKKEAVADTSGVDWDGLLQSGTIGSAKVPDLKAYLKSVGEPVSGAKAVLVERVTQHLSKKGQTTGDSKIKQEV